MPDKYQKQIEELLRDISNSPPKHANRRQQSPLRSALGGMEKLLANQGWNVSPRRVLLGGFILLLLAWWFTSMLSGIAGLVALIAIILFILMYVFFFITNSKSAHEKRWRGELLEQSHSPWWVRLRHREKR